MELQATNLGGGLALRGILALLFGAAAVFWPGLTIVTLVYLFSAFVLVNGVIDLVFGISRLGAGVLSLSRLLTVVLGALQVGVGVYLLRHPHVGFTAMILLIGFTLIVRGVFELVAGLFEVGTSKHKAIAEIGGLVAAVAGILMLFQPQASGVAFVWILGIYALVTGPMYLALAMESNDAAPLAARRR